MIEKITDRDYAELAGKIGCHPADLEAIAKVESGKSGWFKDGRMKILFEKHWFYKLVQPVNRNKAVRMGLARRKWISPSKGGYKEQNSPNARYNILKKAIKLDEQAAYKSISMGTFQIMGFNSGFCGFISAKEMYTKFSASERWQLIAFTNFLKAKGLFAAIRERRFDRVEKTYNGGGLNGAYARKMRREADKMMKGKWKDWQGWKDWEAKHGTPPVKKSPAPVTSKKPAAAASGAVVAAGGIYYYWDVVTAWWCSLPLISNLCGG